MGLFSRYPGIGINHVEVLYNRGERALATRFLELLGCVVEPTTQKNETGSTYIIVHPDRHEDDPVNNVMYLSEVREQQHDLERILSSRAGQDAELGTALEAYKAKARSRPHGIPHFGLRFPTFESVEPVLERLERNTDRELAGRFSLTVVRPQDPEALTADMIQAFVYTDLIASGLFCVGQLIELQAQRSPA